MNKFGAKKTEYNGVMYDSKKEANYAMELDLDPNVETWERQVCHYYVRDFKQIFKYFLDFAVKYKDGRKEYVDIKGWKKGCAYQLFRLKKKLIEAYYSIEIKEV